MTEAAPLLGALAALVGIAGMTPYLRDTLRGDTRPLRVTWLIWTLLAIVVWLSQRADGASWSLLFAGVHAVLNAVVFVLALGRGSGGGRWADAAIVLLAGCGITGWLLTGHALTATLCVVAADLVALAAMTPKTWRDPWSETLSTFACASLGGALAAGAVATVDVTLLAYPLYYCLANGGLAIVIAVRRHVLLSLDRIQPLAGAVPVDAR
jgi:hypothetical protein